VIGGSASCNMVFADDMDGRRLRTFFSLGRTEAHFNALLKIRELAVNDAIAVKVDLQPVRRFDEAEAFLREQFDDAAMLRRLVRLGGALHNPGRVLNLPARLCKCLAHGNADMLLFWFVSREMGDNDFPMSRNMNVDPHLKEPAAVMALLWRSYRYTARDDPSVKLLELLDFLIDDCSHRWIVDRRVDYDMRGDFHSLLQTAQPASLSPEACRLRSQHGFYMIANFILSRLREILVHLRTQQFGRMPAEMLAQRSKKRGRCK